MLHAYYHDQRCVLTQQLVRFRLRYNPGSSGEVVLPSVLLDTLQQTDGTSPNPDSAVVRYIIDRMSMRPNQASMKLSRCPVQRSHRSPVLLTPRRPWPRTRGLRELRTPLTMVKRRGPRNSNRGAVFAIIQEEYRGMEGAVLLSAL